MGINIQRVIEDMEVINSINATPFNGITRFSYSEEDKRARDYLLAIMKSLDLEISIDGVGNIRAKLCNSKNRNLAPVMVGSHIDTVLNGGKFDGLTGVIVGLEVLRILKETYMNHKKPVELIIFAEEEGSNFDLTLLGSKCITGHVDECILKEIRNEHGKSAYEVIKSEGYNVDNIKEHIIQRGSVDAMIELHVEQGGILDRKKIPIGIVEAIVGMNTLRILIKGVSNHAGSTPMNMRNDPLIAASELIQKVKEITISKDFKNTVTTVGKVFVYPNKSNVIPENVELYVDIRDVNEEGIKRVKNQIVDISKKLEIDHGVIIESSLVSESDVVELSPRIINKIEENTIKESIEYIRMNSGAVHDSVMLAGLTDVGMIFVPSIKGFSHSRLEDTNFEDIKKGGDILLNTIGSIINE